MTHRETKSDGSLGSSVATKSGRPLTRPQMARPSEVGPEILEKLTLGQVAGQCLFEKSDPVQAGSDPT